MPISIKSNPMMLREIIMDHYQNPRNRREVSDSSYKEVHMDSASCIDDIFIQVKIDNDKVVDCCWHGTCCAISTASTSIMTEIIKDKSLEEAKYIMSNFNKMLMGQEFDEECLGEAIAFINTNRQPSRIGCATIAWRGLDEIFKEDEKEHHHG